MSDSDRDQRIRELAYTIWLDAGCPDGQADEHWRMASEEIERDDAALMPGFAEETAPLIPPNR